MPSPFSAPPEKPRKPVSVDEAYTVSVTLAAQLLGRTEPEVEKLVEISRRNVKNEIDGPLVIADGGLSLTLASVLDYRRKLSSCPSV
ncbi:hypothetical protein ACWD7M_16465 [Streptomyces griseus]